MAKQITEALLGLSICPGSTRWPEKGSSPWWNHFHTAVEFLHSAGRAAELKISAIQRDNDLSDVGRLRQVADVALQVLAEISKSREVAEVKRVVAATVAAIDGRAGSVIKPPSTPAEVAVAAEIRAYVQRLPETKRLTFARDHIGGDVRVLGALLSAPSFLSGLTAGESTELHSIAAAALSPDDARMKADLTKALAHLEEGVRHARRLVAERGGLLQLGPDAYGPPNLAKSKAAA